jgi:hypothetical protein
MAATAMIAGPASDFSGMLPTVSRNSRTVPMPAQARAAAAGLPVPRLRRRCQASAATAPSSIPTARVSVPK